MSVSSAETIKCRSCCWVRAKVRDFKLSLITVLPSKVYTLCLMVSSWHCSLSFGLEDKDNPVKFLPGFFLSDWEGQQYSWRAESPLSKWMKGNRCKFTKRNPPFFWRASLLFIYLFFFSLQLNSIDNWFYWLIIYSICFVVWIHGVLKIDFHLKRFGRETIAFRQSNQ